MIKAYILVNIDIRYEDIVLKTLKHLPGITDIHRLHGVFDVIIKINVSDQDDLNILIINQLRQIQGIITTSTLIISD
jgi:DNA-binding Lrp family transcriptional regulator